MIIHVLNLRLFRALGTGDFMENQERQTWNFEECTHVMNKLQFFTNGMGLIEIVFDIDGQPSSIRALDGAPYWTPIPAEDQKQLFARVKRDYPYGFHSRCDEHYFNWLKSRLDDLAGKHSLHVLSLTRHGSLMVDGIHQDAYQVTLDHPKICKPLYVVKTGYESFAVFRPYIHATEFGCKENIAAFVFNDEPSSIMTEECPVAFWDKEIVSVKEYRFSGNTLKGDSYAFKNPDIGFAFKSKFGNFLSAGGSTYFL